MVIKAAEAGEAKMADTAVVTKAVGVETRVVTVVTKAGVAVVSINFFLHILKKYFTTIFRHFRRN